MHRPKYKKRILFIIAAIISLVIVTPVLADYIGPVRTVTESGGACEIVLYECQFVTAKNIWKYKRENSWSCSSESKPWQAYSGNSRTCNDNTHTAGYQYWEREDTSQEVTYPPATINSSLQNCTLQNGWCVTAPQLSLSASEPVSGYNIIAIEGSLNGQNFACTNSSCSVPLNEGDNNFAYWALSSFGDSSTMGALTAQVDSQLPNITGTFTGTAGSNGWYLSPVSFNGSASDATSGLASFTCTLDGIAVGSCNSIKVNSDGLHTIALAARDNAGNTRTLTQNTSLDTQNPVINASLSGTMGSNNWYTAAILNASASDAIPGSGLSAFQHNLDNSGWITFPASGALNLSDGKHNVDLRAIDNAGRTVSSAKPFWLDTVPPNVTVDSAGTSGLNDWYTTSLTLAASASDATSRMDIFEYSLDTGAWTTYSTPLSLTDGAHNISFWAQDSAGLVTQLDRSYKVDTSAPQISGSLSAVLGMNGWYISDVMLSASASDPMPGSGLSAFTYILNGGVETPYTNVLTLSDGQHTIQLNVRDEAGLSYSTAQIVRVDTTRPSLNIHTTLPNWIKDNITLTGATSDGGSGISKVEISTDGGQIWQATTGITSWSYAWNTPDSPNGIREVHVRVVDHAGLTTEHIMNVGLDNSPPRISMPDSWYQWDIVTLDVWDKLSGLSEVRVEISDPEGRWPKRVIHLDPERFPIDFKWDRRFGDDTIAPLGVYDMKVIAFDNLGNMARQSASIRILLDILPAGPTSTPQSYSRTEFTPTPVIYTATPISSPVGTQTAVVSIFGATPEPAVQATPMSETTPTPRTAPTQTSVLDWLESVFLPNSNSAESVTEIGSPEESKDDTQPATAGSSSVLWGTAAASAIAAATAYAQEERRKREEEKARQAALEAQQEERREKMKERKTEKMEAKRSQEEAWEEARQQAWNPAHIDRKVGRLEDEEGALNSLKTSPPATSSARSTSTSQDRRAERKDELVQEETNAYTAKPQEWKADYDDYMAQKALAEAARKEKESSESQPKKKTWWDKTLDFVDDHQTELALGVGVVVGVLAIVLTGGLAIAPVTAVIGAMVAAGVTVGAVTVGLNTHYDRPWHENLLKNVALAGGAAAAVSIAGFLYPAASTSIGSYCAIHQSTCARVEPVFKALDVVEENWLKAKLAYQTWRGDQSGAADTAFELHSEYADGGMPGNAVAKELGEQVNYLSKNAIPVIQKYGNDVIPLLVKHGDEGLQLIQKYGVDGIALLQKYGNDATDLIHLDKDVLDYVMQQSDDAVAALSRWSAKDLREHGLELALRAQKDADVLADIKKLTSSGPIDPKNLTKDQNALLEAIAANSTQYAENGQVVLGKWVDIDSGFVQTAQDTGSVHYNPHPDMWTMLGKLGDSKQEEVAWLINKQVVQKGIDKGLPFEYTLNGVPSNILDNEHAAVEAIFSGKTEAEIKEVLELEYMPIRMKELQELQKVGYELTFDEVTNSYILMLP